MLGWDTVWALEDQQRRRLHRIWERGVAWKPSSASTTGSGTAAASKADARELRHRAVRRFAEVYTAAGEDDKAAVDAAVRHLYAPDLKAGWGVHVVQEIKVLVPKAQRDALDAAIQELVDLGIQRYHDSRICPCSLLTACSNLLFDFLATLGSKGLVFFVCLADDFAILALRLIIRPYNVVFLTP